MFKFSQYILLSAGLLSQGILSAMISAPIKEALSVIAPQSSEPVKKETVVSTPQTSSAETSPSIFVTAEALYWQTHFVPLFTFKQTITDKNNADFFNYKGKNPHPHWDWGFRVGAGWLPPVDYWEVGFHWMHVQIEAIGNTRANTGRGEVLTVFSPNSNTAPVALEAREKVLLLFNIADLMLSHDFFLSKRFVLKPGMGLKYFKLKTEQNTIFRDVTFGENSIADQPFKIKNDFWGLGPQGHLNLQWHLGWDLSIFGNFGVSFLYGQFDLKQTSLVTNATQELRGIVPSIDGNLGLAWDRSFGKGEYHLIFHASWEHHIYFQILQPDLIGSFDVNGGNLSTEGITLGLRFDF